MYAFRLVIPEDEIITEAVDIAIDVLNQFERALYVPQTQLTIPGIDQLVINILIMFNAIFFGKYMRGVTKVRIPFSNYHTEVKFHPNLMKKVQKVA